MREIYKKPEALNDNITHYCPGCGHGIAHRLIAEVIDELKIRERVIGVAPVGCAVLAYNYFNFDVAESAHGRTPAVATGIKRALPDNIVFSYQGDGDLAAIGTAEIVHAANRSENISVFFVNNTVYGMTGGQMAPTTLEGQKTLTTPSGREKGTTGSPIKVCELLSVLEGARYLYRGALSTPSNILKVKKAIKDSFQIQIAKKGFSLVEIISPCPTYWGLTPLESLQYIDNKLLKVFPLGEIKNTAR
ncbi:thiamine pyrophosphate-dependent enzyme [bacterium]|jgi:2-oxoglutarate ferredoxin oxidoreductase subunit beta|nr:thiamine pyrophosphate-dependent enzyme [bacterium]